MTPLKKLLSLALSLLFPISDVLAAVRLVNVAPAPLGGSAVSAVGAISGLNTSLNSPTGSALVAPPSVTAMTGPRVLGVTPQVPPDVAVAHARYPELAQKTSVADPKVETAGRAATVTLSRVDRERLAAGPSTGANDSVSVSAGRQNEREKSPAELGNAPGGQVAVRGDGAAAANDLSRSLASLGPNAGGIAIREKIGAAFDGSGAQIDQDVAAVDAPLGAAEVFGAVAGALTVPSDRADFLAGLGDELAAWRGVRAARGEAALTAEQASILRGVDDLARAVAIGDTDPAVLQVSVDVVETMAQEKLEAFSRLAWDFMNTQAPGSTPFAQVGNVEHVSQQLLDPLNEDGADLAKAFKSNPKQTQAHFVELIRALQMATDTGKQENPADLKAALAYFDPKKADPKTKDSYVHNYILPHEYASMIWVEKFGKQAGFNAREILAFQRLIANHNFGPDLTKPENAQMRNHWWPREFRRQMLPMMQAMGIDIGAHFNKDEHGQLQYNHTQGNRYSLILSVYDRAIAVAANANGVATWKKYATQYYNGKVGELKGIRTANASLMSDLRKLRAVPVLYSDPEGLADENGKRGPIFEFDGPFIISVMEEAADWAEQHVESLWNSLYASLPKGHPILEVYPDAEMFRMYPPYYKQRKSIGSLNGLLRQTKAANPVGQTNRSDIVPQAGTAYYEVPRGPLAGVYRVVLTREGPGAFEPDSTDYTYKAVLEVSSVAGKQVVWRTPTGPRFGEGNGKIAVSGDNPVALYTDFIRTVNGW